MNEVIKRIYKQVLCQKYSISQPNRKVLLREIITYNLLYQSAYYVLCDELRINWGTEIKWNLDVSGNTVWNWIKEDE